MDSPETLALLHPDFESACWRRVEFARFRDQAAFSKKKKHFEPDEHNSFASRWAGELTRDDRLAETRQIYENAVAVLGMKRSQMDRGDSSLDCAQFRFAVTSEQDSVDPKLIRTARSLIVKIPLHDLPDHFDAVFPYPMNELVVPFAGGISPREILLAFEEWEARAGGRIEESADQTLFRLVLPSGLSLAADLSGRETVFAVLGVEGVKPLAGVIAAELRRLAPPKKLE